MTIPVQKIVLGAGATVVGYGVIRAIASGPVVAMGCFMVVSLLFVIFGAIFNWTYYDQSVHLALSALAFSIIAIGALFYAGEIITALLSIVVIGVFAIGLGAYSHQIDVRWDTSERRFDERMARGCDAYYDYSTADGYCHFNHKYHDDAFYSDNSGLRDLVVPNDRHLDEIPLPGARENIARLTAGTPRTLATGAEWTPSATVETPTTTEATAQPVHRSFFGALFYHPFIGIFILAAIKYFWEVYKARPTSRPTIDREREIAILPPQSKSQPKPVYPWLAEGRKAAGLD